MKKKPGYPILLAITIAFTLTGGVTLILSLAKPASIGGGDVALQAVAVMVPLFLAGLTCIIRKRFFTVPG